MIMKKLLFARRDATASSENDNGQSGEEGTRKGRDEPDDLYHGREYVRRIELGS